MDPNNTPSLEKSCTRRTFFPPLPLSAYRKADDNFANLPPRRGRVKSWILFGYTQPRDKVVIAKNKIYPLRQRILDLEAQKDGDMKPRNMKSRMYTAKDLCLVIRPSYVNRDIR